MNNLLRVVKLCFIFPVWKAVDCDG